MRFLARRTTGAQDWDYLHLMLEAHDENMGVKSSGYLSNEEIVVEVITFILYTVMALLFMGLIFHK